MIKKYTSKEMAGKLKRPLGILLRRKIMMV
jgi:hypothetical protein